MDDYLSKYAAANALNISYPTLTTLIVRKKIPVVRQGKYTLIHKETIAAYLEAQAILNTLKQAA